MSTRKKTVRHPFDPEEYPGMELRSWLVYDMIKHRGFSLLEVAKAAGFKGYSAFYSVQAGRYEGNPIKILDKLEAGIDKLCKERGYVCTCTPLQVAATADAIERGLLVGGA